MGLTAKARGGDMERSSTGFNQVLVVVPHNYESKYITGYNRMRDVGIRSHPFIIPNNS
jgi:hypothetical protein